MKNVLLICLALASAFVAKSQKVDSIYFHLYTDSLKKGTYNYISVDGKTQEGKWKPLSAKDIEFTTSYGEFKGNELVLPDTPTVQKVKIKAVLRSNPAVWREVTVWIKTMPDPDNLPTNDDILSEMKKPKKKKG